MLLHGTQQESSEGLMIGNLSCQGLKHRYGTPLIIYDQALIESQAALFIQKFTSRTIQGEIAYASKAFSAVGLLSLMRTLGLSVDVSSSGELYTAVLAGFSGDKIYYHGNNKLPEELDYALDQGVSTFIIDHRQEVNLLAARLEQRKQRVNVYLRINPGIEAHTHEYIKTAKHDSKFGESIFTEDIYSIIEEILGCRWLDLQGFHSHIGSQIFAESSFFKAAAEVLDFYVDVQKRFSCTLPSMDLGGGFGVYYTDGDVPIQLESFLGNLMAYLETEIKKRGLAIKKVVLEPGRSLVCNAGSTLYTVGGTKTTYSGKNYCFVDGGMSDNPRPALYQAAYEATLANRMHEAMTTHYTIAGKLCESGDILIRDIMLPEARSGDLLLVSSTGAYTYSMASNYNRLLKPAVILVKDGISRLIVRRETLDDLIRMDVVQ